MNKLITTFFFLLPAMLLLGAGPTFSQSSTPHYLPNTLVIKYEDEQRLNELRNKSSSDPRNGIREFLSPFGASAPRPIWTDQAARTTRNKTIGLADNTAANKAIAELQRIHTIHFSADVDAEWLAAKVSRLPGVEYAEPRYLRFTQYEPNDPSKNPYEAYHRFYEAWDVTQGSSDIIIAIIDSGVDYNHDDLDGKLWENEDEIADNGTDDDGNGFVDDVIGWDFWASGTTSDNITEDNDPMMDANDHGTHVTGIAAAETDNGIGISGAGFNARYMAVKAGGVPEEPEAIGFGFDGILYAVNNGADIINCSWGGSSFSEVERDVIRYATSLGAVVVAAAGNEGRSEVLYPAAFREAVAVGWLEPSTNTISGRSNFGYDLDLLATGSSIESTVDNNGYAAYSGTSMSTPVVSGLAALVKTLHPGWSGRRIATHLRATADPLEDSNRLGRGSINAYRAVSEVMPGIVVTGVSFINEAGEKLGLEEPGSMLVSVANYGEPTSSLTLNASSITGNGIQLSNPTQQLGSIPNGDTTQITFPVHITSEFNLANTPTFRIDFTDSPSSYSDFGIVQYDNLLYDTMAGNRVKMTVAANGTIGFTNPLSQQGGVGFIPRMKIDNKYEEGDNLLFEGGLMLQIDGTLHDAVRSEEGSLSRDFTPKSTVRLEQPGEQADLQGATHFHSDTVDNITADIRLTSYAYEDPERSNVVFLRYEINNPSFFFELENVYAGLFNDWDIGSSAGNNGISYSSQDSILYIYDEDPESTQPVVAVASLGPLSSAFAIDNAAEGGNLNFGIYDGYTDEEKKKSLKADTDNTAVSGTDVSAVVASGPYTVGANATVSVGFVYAFGENLDELRSQIQQARSQTPFQVSPRGRIAATQQPQATEIFQNYPNPFNGSTRIRLDLAQKRKVNISIYNVLGRKIAELVDGQLEPRIHIFNFDAGSLSSGIYFARLKTDNRTKTIKMLLVK